RLLPRDDQNCIVNVNTKQAPQTETEHIVEVRSNPGKAARDVVRIQRARKNGEAGCIHQMTKHFRSEMREMYLADAAVQADPGQPQHSPVSRFLQVSSYKYSTQHCSE